MCHGGTNGSVTIKPRGAKVEKIVFFDLETGGFDPAQHAIIQIAAIAVDADSFDEVGTFEKKLKFPAEASTQEALEVNSFDPDVWDRHAVGVDEAEQVFSAFLREHATKKCISRAGKPYWVSLGCAHNGSSFDGPFLKAWYGRRGKFMPMWPVVMDTHQLALWVYQWRDDPPENFKLGTLAKHLGITVDGDLHDALTDVRVAVKVCQQLKEIHIGNPAAEAR